MELPQSEDVNVLIQNYQKANRTLLNRAVVMAVLSILIFGIHNSIVRNEQKRRGLNDAIFKLREVVNSEI